MLTGAGAVKPRAYAAHRTIPIHEDTGRVAHDVIEEGQLGPRLFLRCKPPIEDGVFHRQHIPEPPQARNGLYRVVVFLERDGDDLQSLVMVLRVHLVEQPRFINTVRTPAAHYLDHHGVPHETGVFRRNHRPVQVGEMEIQHVISLAKKGERIGVPQVIAGIAYGHPGFLPVCATPKTPGETVPPEGGGKEERM